MNDQNRIEVEIRGRTFDGRYTVNAGVVTVTSMWGMKSTHSGASAQATAGMLLREIVREAMARGEAEA